MSLDWFDISGCNNWRTSRVQCFSCFRYRMCPWCLLMDDSRRNFHERWRRVWGSACLWRSQRQFWVHVRVLCSHIYHMTWNSSLDRNKLPSSFEAWSFSESRTAIRAEMITATTHAHMARRWMVVASTLKTNLVCVHWHEDWLHNGPASITEGTM